MLKVAIIGPESTGKSSLCKELAEYYQTIWIREYAREYLQIQGAAYSYEDLLTIAQGQLLSEENLNSFPPVNIALFDTNLYVMQVWSEYVFNRCDLFILDSIAAYDYDLYLLCLPDLPWEADILREYPDPAIREELFHFYKSIMVYQHVPWTIIKGNYKERFALASTAINKLLT